MSYRMVVVGVVIILIPHIILGIVEIKFAVFGFINGNFRLLRLYLEILDG